MAVKELGKDDSESVRNRVSMNSKGFQTILPSSSKSAGSESHRAAVVRATVAVRRDMGLSMTLDTVVILQQKCRCRADCGGSEGKDGKGGTEGVEGRCWEKQLRFCYPGYPISTNQDPYPCLAVDISNDKTCMT